MESVVNLLNRCSPLEHIGFYSPAPTMLHQIIHGLALYPNLRQLDIRQAIQLDTVVAADLELIPQPCPSPKKVDIGESSVLHFHYLLQLRRRCETKCLTSCSTAIPYLYLLSMPLPN
ncbi:hypothetical protein BDW68DRAFT_167906 [Aspergillus falconensis]